MQVAAVCSCPDAVPGLFWSVTARVSDTAYVFTEKGKEASLGRGCSVHRTALLRPCEQDKNVCVQLTRPGSVNEPAMRIRSLPGLTVSTASGLADNAIDKTQTDATALKSAQEKNMAKLWLLALAFGIAAGWLATDLTASLQSQQQTGETDPTLLLFVLALLACAGCVALAREAARKAGQSGEAGETVQAPAPAEPEAPSATDLAVCAVLHQGVDAMYAAILSSPEVSTAQNREEAARQAVLHALPALVDKMFEDNEVTPEEEQDLMLLLQKVHVSHYDTDQKLMYRIARAGLIRDLLNGDVKPRMTVEGSPFLLQKTEIPVWFWPSVTVTEEATVSEWVSGSKGISVRVARGLYWHMGGSRGHRETREVDESLGTGGMLLTNRHLYFQGYDRALRIRLSKIISMEVFASEVVIYREGTRAKPLTILTDDAWFLGNCLSNAQNWA